MTNEELTELCTRVATKVLGWNLLPWKAAWRDCLYWMEKYDDKWIPICGPGDFSLTETATQSTHDITALASPWGRDLVEQATFPQGFIVEIHYSKSKYLGGWVCEIGIAKGRSGWRTFYRSDIAADDLNLACLLTADKAVSDD